MKEKVKPMIMQLAEPEYMCPECGVKFYAWHRDERPKSCEYCHAEFDWKNKIKSKPEEEYVML